MKRKMLSLILALAIVVVPIFTVGRMQVFTVNNVKSNRTGPDLYIKDTPSDTGIEPNPDTGPMWVTEDIWVRNNPDPGYQPYAFPELSPPWTPLAHENPEYRDPKYSTPNYVYVRVRNRGTSASTGTERLKLYWAKASTGLGWPAQWVDYLANNCGPTKLYGAEITKPRKNAATATVAERNAYVNAIVAVGTNPSFVFPDKSYWHKQDEVHEDGPINRHGTGAFSPWHREFINRYEVLLQEADPTVKLLYWDWTTNPNTSFGTFMGGWGIGGLANIGSPFMPAFGTPTIYRNLGGTLATPTSTTDASLFGIGLYPSFRSTMEGGPHGYSHVYIGGSGGNMGVISTAAEDPVFFMLHGDADRLWAQWQRNTSFVSRLDTATAYDAESGNVNLTTNMAPWNGVGTPIRPWTIADGYIVSKSPKHASVVSPPIYDTAPLVVPILQPGEACVIQIPWYPPNPADFACFGGDQGHVCLLGRVETSTTAPYGMTFAEGPDVNLNTKNNNNIAWRNVTVVDNFPGALRISSVLIRNIFRERVLAGLRFATPDDAASFFEFGNILVDLKPELFARWREGRAEGQGVEVAGETTIRITSPEALIQNIRLEPNEMFSVDVRFELIKGRGLPPRGVIPKLDLIQIGTPDDPNGVVGGQRYEVNLDKLVLVKEGSEWRYQDNGEKPESNWTSLDFDESRWKLGHGEFGFGDDPVTTIDGGKPGDRHITTYFRQTFDVADPGFYQNLFVRLKRDDGAVVYLNGTEVRRVNMPGGAVSSATLATKEVDGLQEEVFFPIPVDQRLLRKGQNVIAVEVHQNSPDSDDLSFDLELYSNPVAQGFAPEVGFIPSIEGSLWQNGQVIPVTVEALDTDGSIRSVSLYADGRFIATDDKAPYTFQVQGATLGAHRLRAVAMDNEKRESLVETTVVVLGNVPPSAQLIQPLNGAMFPVGGSISLVATASDPNDGIKQVDFYVQEAESFSSKEKLIGSGTRSGSLYTITLKDLEKGHYMVWAVAVDERGATSQSMPIHIGIH